MESIDYSNMPVENDYMDNYAHASDDVFQILYQDGDFSKPIQPIKGMCLGHGSPKVKFHLP